MSLVSAKQQEQCLLALADGIDRDGTEAGTQQLKETGQSIIAIDPASLGHGRFAASMTRLAEAIESQPGAVGALVVVCLRLTIHRIRQKGLAFGKHYPQI